MLVYWGWYVLGGSSYRMLLAFLWQLLRAKTGILEKNPGIFEGTVDGWFRNPARKTTWKKGAKTPSKIEWDLTNGPLSKLLELLDTQV